MATEVSLNAALSSAALLDDILLLSILTILLMLLREIKKLKVKINYSVDI